MKRTIIAAGLLLLLATPAWSSGLGVMLSYWDTDQAGDDNGLGLKFELGLGETIEFELRAAFLERYEAPVGTLRVPPGLTLFEFEAVPVDIGLAYNFRGRRATPYVGGGASYVLFDSPNGRVEDELGYYGVIGVEVGAGDRFSVFGEALYRGVKAELEGPGLPFFAKTQVDFAGAAFNLGVQFRW